MGLTGVHRFVSPQCDDTVCILKHISGFFSTTHVGRVAHVGRVQPKLT